MIAFCQWCHKMMVIENTPETETDRYIKEHYHAKFTGKFYHNHCFWAMAKKRHNLVSPEEL